MNDKLSMESFSEALNDLTFQDYYNRLSMIALSVFKWENLPNNINERWIEKYLFTHGECMFFKHDILGEMVSRCNAVGINPYDEPTYLMPVITNDPGIELKEYKNNEECVLIKNNDMSLSSINTIRLYAYRLAEIRRTQDINIKAQKTPFIVVMDNNQKMTLKNVYKKYEGNEPVIYVSKGSGVEDSLKVYNTNAPIVFDKLQNQAHQLWNEVMTFLGINNANMDKKERLVDDEVQANNQQIEISFHSMLKARESAAKEINRLFGTKIKVGPRLDLMLNMDDFMNQLGIASDGSENGSEGGEVA